MRETELWRRLERHLGRTYAHSWADRMALPGLGSRTVLEAIAAGVPFKSIWEASWAALELPDSER